MASTLDAIRRNKMATLLISVSLGIVFRIIYGWIRLIGMPMGEYIGKFVIDPYQSGLFPILLFNAMYSLVAGAASSVIILMIVNYLFRPTTMVLPLLTLFVYALLSYAWYFASYISGIEGNEIDDVLAKLVSPLGGIIFFAVCSLWMVNKNKAHKMPPTKEAYRNRSPHDNAG